MRNFGITLLIEKFSSPYLKFSFSFFNPFLSIVSHQPSHGNSWNLHHKWTICCCFYWVNFRWICWETTIQLMFEISVKFSRTVKTVFPNFFSIITLLISKFLNQYPLNEKFRDQYPTDWEISRSVPYWMRKFSRSVIFCGIMTPRAFLC